MPRLVSDTRRGWAAIGLALIPSVVAQVALVSASTDDSSVKLLVTSYFVTWASVGLFYVLLAFMVFGRVDGETLGEWLRRTTPRTRRARFWLFLSGGGSRSWAVYGSLVSVGAVLVLSAVPAFREDPLVLVSGIVAVVSSLGMIISAYAIQYARTAAIGPGIEFPGAAVPRFADFFYLAVQVSTTFSSSDVTLTTTSARRIVTGNSIISFAFNTVIVALLVSVLVSSGS